MKSFLSKIKNAFSLGYSGCGICGDTWNWKKEHIISYAPGSGAFPVCEECWQTKSDEEIIAAAESLARLWRADGAPDECAELMVAATKRDLKKRGKLK